jgi:hypothetical protein
MFTAFYSVIFACKRLGRKGISNIARNQFLRKHSVYVGVFLVVWSIQLLHNYNTLFDQDSKNLETISFFAMFTTGFFLASARVIVDPYHRWLIKYYIAQWFGIELDEPSENEISQPLNTYLAKSLNLELINIILQGISKFATEDYDHRFER